MSKQRPFIRFERKYWIDHFTTEDVRFITRLFGTKNCEFVTRQDVVNVSVYGRIMPTAGRRESTVTIRFTKSKADNFTFFDLRFPEAWMISETCGTKYRK